MEKTLLDIQYEGKAAYKRYLNTTHNPYEKDSVEYHVWLLGWKQQQKEVNLISRDS